MKQGIWATVKVVAVGTAMTLYVLLAHHVSNLPPEDGGRFAALAMLPYLAIAAALAWRSRHRLGWLLGCAALAVLTWLQVKAIGEHAAWVYFVQHAGGNAFMAVVFGITLVGDRVPLCSRIAILVHGTLEPKVARYTRQVTAAWTIFFAASAAISVGLFAFAPTVVWSVFANILCAPLVALTFVVEYFVRLQLLPDVKHVSLLDGIRLYLRTMRTSPPPAV